MKSTYLAHLEFHSVWDKEYVNKTKLEPIQVTEARDRFFGELNRLFNELSKYEKDFFNGDPKAIDNILDFLETDIPAFRCGYAKEKFYRRLKSMKLTQKQVNRIRNLAYEQCGTKTYRREFRDLARLMIKLADSHTVNLIKELEETSEGITKFKSNLMLKTILHNRNDL
jgi:hypothetical protein